MICYAPTRLIAIYGYTRLPLLRCLPLTVLLFGRLTYAFGFFPLHDVGCTFTRYAALRLVIHLWLLHAIRRLVTLPRWYAPAVVVVAVTFALPVGPIAIRCRCYTTLTPFVLPPLYVPVSCCCDLFRFYVDSPFTVGVPLLLDGGVVYSRHICTHPIYTGGCYPTV